MSQYASVSHYAEGFLAAFTADWQRYEEGLAASAELRDFLAAPEHSLDEKKQLLRQVFADALDPFTLSMLSLLLEQGQLELSPEISATALELLSRWRDKLTVIITTAQPLPPAEEQELLAMLKQRHGKEIMLEKNVDPSLIGGAVLKIGDKLFDGSVKSQLESLKRELLK